MPFTLREHNTLAEEMGLPPAYRGAVISVHGMKTRGAWQKELGPCLQDAGIRHVAVDYGWVLSGILFKRTRERVAEKILRAYEEQASYHNNPGAIGHSLGSLGIGTALQQYPDVVLRRIVLFGSILPCDYPWSSLSKRGQVERVLNERAKNDPWPKVAARIVRGCGASGCDGFNNAEDVVQDSGYDHTGHSGLAYRLHFKRVWIPFLRGTHTIVNPPA